MPVKVSMEISYRRIFEGECIPWGYGIAWRDIERDYAICYPIPLNIILAALRRCYYRLVRGLAPAEWERQMRTWRRTVRELEKEAAKKSY